MILAHGFKVSHTYVYHQNCKVNRKLFGCDSRVYFKKNLELHILRMLQNITCLTGGSKGV
jgi:hypothetical protein